METQTSIPAPGEFIREELAARDWSQRDLAYVLGVADKTVNMIVGGRSGISAEMAKRLGDAFDVPAEFFVNLQSAYDLARATAPDPSVSKKARLQGKFPVREMIRRGWLEDVETALLERQVTRFFECVDLEEVPYISHAAKKSSHGEASAEQLAWLYRVRQIAREMVLRPYSSGLLRAALDKLQALTLAPEEARHVPRILEECGLRFVVAEGLPGGKIDGVCTWLDRETPVIGMSLRFDRIDNFWFVLRHEIEHVLRRDGLDAAVIDAELEGSIGEEQVECERLANEAAAEFCVPQKAVDSFIARKHPYISEKDILAFAARHKVHAGIVAGQVRRKTQNWRAFGRHLVKVRAHIADSATVDGWGVIAPVSAI